MKILILHCILQCILQGRLLREERKWRRACSPKGLENAPETQGKKRQVNVNFYNFFTLGVKAHFVDVNCSHVAKLFVQDFAHTAHRNNQALRPMMLH